MLPGHLTQGLSEGFVLFQPDLLCEFTPFLFQAALCFTGLPRFTPKMRAGGPFYRRDQSLLLRLNRNFGGKALVFFPLCFFLSHFSH